eukprot:5268351-Prymnesium_polylepis.1
MLDAQAAGVSAELAGLLGTLADQARAQTRTRTPTDARTHASRHAHVHADRHAHVHADRRARARARGR